MGLPIEVPRGLPMGSAFVVHPRYVPFCALDLRSIRSWVAFWVEMTSSRAASAVQFGGTTAQGPNAQWGSPETRASHQFFGASASLR